MIYGRAGAPAGPLDTGRNSKPPCRASGTPRIIRRTGLGEPPAVSPTRTPSRLTHMSSGESGQQGPQGLCTAPELGRENRLPPALSSHGFLVQLCSPGPPATVLGRLPRKGFRAEPHAYVLTLLSSGRAVSTPGCFSVCGPPPPELALGSAGLSWDQCLGTAAPLC